MLYALPNEALLCLGYFVSLVQEEGAVYSICLGLYDVCSLLALNACILNAPRDKLFFDLYYVARYQVLMVLAGCTYRYHLFVPNEGSEMKEHDFWNL